MSAAAELDRSRYLSLTTFRMNGAEIRTPVWLVPLDGRLYVFTAGESGKVRRLRRSPRARVAACDARGGIRGPWLDVTARVITDAVVIARAREAFRRKYGWQVALLDLFARLSGRIRRRAWIEIVR
jgi:PPOX class probable F420-dependent enzyme